MRSDSSSEWHGKWGVTGSGTIYIDELCYFYRNSWQSGYVLEAATKMPQRDIVPATPDSQQEFTMGEPHCSHEGMSSAQPILLAQFLDSFNGCEISVDANGQCAMLSFFTSVSSHSTRTLKLAAKIVTPPRPDSGVTG
ncbi:unnamed protein product [Phytophthora fragariaefolia]|uniref:Unnamed protein product n=1 Tax=Phytophthora fragariaefolia TaxID=1490495 RepID=A0A9W7CVE9_9STRA|nr:unnamed protein product [Phytophthora fragariaefolia]